MTIFNWLNAAHIKTPRLDAELILAHVLKVNRTYLHAHPDRSLTKTELKTANQLLARRQNHEPLAYVEGFAYFYGRKFLVTPDVLIPRPETEDLVDLAKTLQPQTILDIGTGSGCIAVTLALELPRSEITATDISLPSLEIARKNWKQLAPNHPITFLQSDLFSNLKNQKFDLVCANLPYVDTAWSWLDHKSLAYEPSAALYAKDHGLSLIKKCVKQAPPFLSQNGVILLEHDPSQHPSITAYARSHNFATKSHTPFVTILTFDQITFRQPSHSLSRQTTQSHSVYFIK